MGLFKKAINRYKNQFYSYDCDCVGKSKFIYSRTVANGEVWYCKKHNTEIMTDEEPREENFTS